MAEPKEVKKADTDATERPETSRPVVFGTQGVISSGHYLTSMAGMRMMLEGGNAFDAVAASVFAASVIEPIASYSLGAESVFMLYDAQSGDLYSLSGQGVAPSRANTDFYKSKGLNSIPTGPGDQAPLAFTVPGVVHATISLLDRYGTKSLGEVLGPSIQYAVQGIPHYQYMINALGAASTTKQFKLFPPGGTEIFYDNGQLPKEGSLLIQPGLATTLTAMANAEANSEGTRSERLQAAIKEFYSGKTAKLISNSSSNVGGILGYNDLGSYESKFEEPLRTTFAGHEICCQGTWSQAAVLLQALNILEQFDLRSMGHNTPIYIHTVTEALKLALADRQAFYGDPLYSDVPVHGLLSKEYGVARAAMINQNHATPNLPGQGNPWIFTKHYPSKGSVPETPHVLTGDPGGEGGTTHISAIDNNGNLACATPSGGSFGKSVFFPELGFALSTRIEMFNLTDGHPNVIEPGKRPRTTLVNYIAIKDGVPTMTFGCPGGDHQAQGNLQLILNTLIFNMNTQESIEAPRFATDSAPDSFYPHIVYPGQLSLEPGFTTETADALSQLGHKVVQAAVCGMGATVSKRDLNTGVLSTGADPRRACYALSW